MKLFLLSLLLLLPLLFIFFSSSSTHIITDYVVFREKPTLSSKKIAVVLKDTELNVLKILPNKKFEHSQKRNHSKNWYFGRWYMVKLKGKIGYVFGAFIEDGKEKFHIFYKKFSYYVRKSYYSGETIYPFVKDRILFPLISKLHTLSKSGDISVTNDVSTKELFSVSAIYKKNNVGRKNSHFFSYSKGKISVCINRADNGMRCSHKWFFRQIKGKWFLVGNKISMF